MGREGEGKTREKDRRVREGEREGDRRRRVREGERGEKEMEKKRIT